MALTFNIDLGLRWTYTSPLDLSTPKETPSLDYSDELASGTAIDQANTIWSDTRTLSATSENLDLYGGLTNSFGTTINFTLIKGIFIKNKATTAGYTLLVGGDSNSVPVFSATNDIIKIGPDGILLLHNPSLAGYAVTNSTGDKLKVDSGANNITYDVIIWGVV